MYLIDTHILLWAISEPSKLTQQEKAILIARDQKIFVSAASIWEIAIKSQNGKLSVPNNLEEYIQQFSFDILSVDFKVAWGIQDLPMYHSDPFDRLIISCAKSHNLTLITRDKIFKKYPITLL